MKLLVINNKSSGRGDNAIYDFLRIISEDGDEIVIRNIGANKTMAELLHDAECFDMVIASGGDGTVTSVCFEMRYRGVPVVPFPSGTGNLLNLNLSAPEEPRALADMVKKANVENYDLGQLEFKDSVGQAHMEGFSIIAGAGFDAMIMETAKDLKGVLGQSAYYVSALMGKKLVKSKITLVIDGKKIHTSGVGVLIVNFAKIAPDLSVTHVNDAQDGLLEVVIIKPDNKLALMPALIAVLRDKRGQHPSRSDVLEIYAGKQIDVLCNPPLPIQYDGEIADAYTPFRATCLPGALKTIVDDMELDRLDALRLMENETSEGSESSGGEV